MGLPGVIAHGMLTMGTALRVVTDWVGDPARVISYARPVHQAGSRTRRRRRRRGGISAAVFRRSTDRWSRSPSRRSATARRCWARPGRKSISAYACRIVIMKPETQQCALSLSRHAEGFDKLSPQHPAGRPGREAR